MNAVYCSAVGWTYFPNPADIVARCGQYHSMIFDGRLLVWDVADRRYVVRSRYWMMF